MKMQDIKVSVIVPIYRVAKYLPKCIESIQKQDHQNMEIILVDDGSDDESGCIADRYAKEDKRIIVIHKKNNGVSAARNTGLEYTTGEYVCFVDGDDFVMPDYVSYLLKLAVDHGSDIAITTAMFGNFNETQTHDMSIQTYDSIQATELMLCYRFPIGVYCRMFKKEFLEEYKLRFRTELFIGEGFNFNMDAIQRAKHITVGHRKVYYYRRDNENSAMTSFSVHKWENGLYAIQVIKNNLMYKDKKIEDAWNYAWWRTNSDAYDAIVMAKQIESHKELYLRCRKIVKNRWLVKAKLPIGKKEKLRATIMVICPDIVPLILVFRRRIFIRNAVS